MATGKSGNFVINGSLNMSSRVQWAETYDPVTNESTLALTPQIRADAPAGYYGYTYYPNGSLKVDGKEAVKFVSATPTHRVSVSSQGTFFSISGSPISFGPIKHNTDGSKSVTIALDIYLYADGSGSSGAHITGSATVDLTAIPRASTIGATDANIGAVSMIAVSRKAAYSHSIAYQFGSLTGYITSAGGTSATEVKFEDTSIPFKLPTSFYAQIPNAKSGECTLVCRTYSGTTRIGGDQTAKFTATADEVSSGPVVSGTVVDSNAATLALTGDPGKLIRFYSTALCTISAQARFSATLAEKQIGGVKVTGNTRSIANVESGEIVFAAKDSRGYSTSDPVAVDMIPYIKLTNNPEAKRTDPTSGNAVIRVQGNYYNGSFGAAANALTLRYRQEDGSWQTAAPTISGNSYTATINLSGLDYQAGFLFEVEISDKLMTIVRTVTIKKGVPVFDWGENDFSFHVPVRMKAGSNLHSVYAGANNGYFKVASLKIGHTYRNAPIIITYTNRYNMPHVLFLRFSNAATAEGHVVSTLEDLSSTANAYMAQSAAEPQVFDLYIATTGSYDSIDILDIKRGAYMEYVTFAWKNEYAGSLPAGAKAATAKGLW